MTSIDEVLAALASSDPQNISAIAKVYGIHPSTLNRRRNRTRTSRDDTLKDKRFLDNQQARSILDHINELYSSSTAPTPTVLTGYAFQLAGTASGHCWVSRL
ncbi:hypothetical protein M433DRAFT_158702 [Acidomyces richmondensis BFW]|nr:MAG: hypothetical protein FE78DRAFT_86105 [Acidomyces sp. 'richmondensis']KYG41735.1 hypothetical protein M433DRAFT_158702 [Acidomyces richmondensis BFW]